jgi:hypothetical protein
VQYRRPQCSGGLVPLPNPGAVAALQSRNREAPDIARKGIAVYAQWVIEV